MKKSILITDSLFIHDDHVAQLEKAGFEVERLDVSCASEEQLVHAIKGKSGYILGGIERVTAKVIAAADRLEAICFTGSGYSEFIPAHEAATKRGIAIATSKGSNAADVAEFAVALMFEMVRNLPLLQTKPDLGGKGFYTARRLQGQTLGIVGFGRIGQEVARLARGIGMKIIATSRRAKKTDQDIKFVPLDELLAHADIVSLHVDKLNGHNVLGTAQIQAMKKGAILINTVFPEAVDQDALLSRLKSGDLRAAFDAAPEIDFSGLPLGSFVASNGSTAFNTMESLKDTSDRSTASMITLLTSGTDKDVVNPEFVKFRN